MSHSRNLLGIMSVGIAVILWMRPAAAQVTRHGSVEFAILPSLNLASFDEDNVTALTFPTVTPGIRMTFWSQSRMTVDFGLSFLHYSEEEWDDVSVLCLEGGPGVDLGGKGAAWRPFVNGIVGMLSISSGDSETEMYVGGQVGLRHFVKDYAATRLQIGYRRTLGDFFELSNIEIAGGVSFFL
ncbi:MAG: hypothetical protein AB1792_11300 [Candidatus Zixiibacteriota bacterium]